MKPVKLTALRSREVLDSRGFPTVEVELTGSAAGSEATERAMVPSGASTGEAEALELRDGDAKRYGGKGVLKALQNIEKRIGPVILGREFAKLPLLDDALRELDGTPNKANLGANAILGVSMAFCRLQARVSGMSLREYLAATIGLPGKTLPVPLMNIVNGGKHADNGLAIQEFMIAPAGFARFSDALRAGVEVFHHLKKILHDRDLSTGVGDEGGFAPRFEKHEQVIQTILEAIQKAGYTPGKDVFLALDCAASEFFKKGQGYDFEGKARSSDEMAVIYAEWTQKYPLVSIEDGLAEHDWAGWTALTAQLGRRCQLVGDDLFVTNEAFLKEGIQKKAGNAILIKVNQIGTLTETLTTMKLAKSAGMNAISSHRSGETEDTFIADLAVGTDCGQIKTGSASRTDRLAKYNQLLRIEESLGARAKFAGGAVFGAFK
jgi:enolase